MSDSDNSSDLDYLAFVARCLDEVNAQPKREPQSNPVDRRVKRQASVLDSLAFISVSQPDQVIAVGAQLLQGGDRGILVLVAENGQVLPCPRPAVVQHLQSVFDRLSEISEARLLGDGSPHIPQYAVDDEDLFQRKIVDLETSVIVYSWAELKRRIIKDARHTNFLETMEDICGIPADERSDCSDEERRLLGPLQSSAGPRKEIESLCKTVRGLVFKLGPLQPNTTHVESVRFGLEKMRFVVKALQKEHPFWRAWNKYTRHRLVKRGMKTKKDPDVHRWLSKVVSIREHFICIVNVGLSSTFSEMLVKGVQVEAVACTTPPLKTISLSLQTLEETLAAAGCEVEGSKEKTPAECFGIMSKAHYPTNLGDGCFETKVNTTNHCEHTILAETHGSPAIAYIGVSKRSCGFCEIYFAAYREVTKSQICTRGAHSQTTAWTCPEFPDLLVDGEIRKKIRVKLLARIHDAWDQYHRRASLPSQSTDASGEPGRK